MARVDRLESAKRVVQLGATIGRELDYELLCAVSGEDEPGLREQLDRAVSSGLLQQHGTVPRATFVFKHALVQDTAYLSLLRKTRAAIATGLQTCSSIGSATRWSSARNSSHHAEAGNTAEAIPYWRKAGNRAIARAAFPEAIAHLLRGIHLLDTLPDGSARDLQELALQSGLGMALQAHRGYAAPEVDHAYTRARVLCQRAGTPEELLSVSRGQNLFYIARGEYRKASDFGTELLRVGTGTASLEHLVEGHMTLGVNGIYLGRVESRSHFEQALAIQRPDHGPLRAFQYVVTPRRGAVRYSAVRWFSGLLRPGDRGQPGRCRRRADVRHSAEHCSGHGHAHKPLSHSGRRRRGGRMGVEDDCVHNPVQIPYWSSLSSMVRGWTLAHKGHVEEGIAQFRQGIDQISPLGQKSDVHGSSSCLPSSMR